MASLLLLATLVACGGGQAYRPVEIVHVDKQAIYEYSMDEIGKTDLKVLEASLDRGSITTNWEKRDGQEYQICVIISPVRVVVQISCRKQVGMEMHSCKQENPPSTLVSHAKALTQKLSSHDASRPPEDSLVFDKNAQ